MKNYGTREYRNIEKHWRDWFRQTPYEIARQDSIVQDFHDQIFELTKGDENKRLCDLEQEMIDERWNNFEKALRIQQSECPIGFFKPSWEQAQALNAWSPEFEPSVCAEGYRSICLFCGNRVGKTCFCVVNTLLWTVPNNPEWDVFQEFEDESPKRRGKYRVLLRPEWEAWRRSGRMLYPPDEPPMSACEIWHGVENDIAWSDKVGKEYIKWAPRNWIGRRSDGGTAIFKQERRIESRFGHSISGKTFNADVQDWAGKAVRILNLDEGLSKNLLMEGLLRIEAGGYFVWPYTPAEARNIGERAKVAFDTYQGKIELVGKAKFFLDFSMEDAPDHIIPPDKKADDIARLSRQGEEGKIRMRGGFFQSSPVVFSNFDRGRNVLPIDGGEVLLAIRGEVPTRWVEAFGKMRAESLQWAFDRANIVRGMDEGLANPTACVWEAILRTGEYVSFREWEQSGLSYGERCREIIERSGNRLKCLNPEAVEERRRYQEEVLPRLGMTVRRTFADSKMFKRDPEKPSDDLTDKYRNFGLRLERAGNIGPGARCDYVNDMLRGEANRKHLLSADLPGPRMYITRDCTKLIERCENYLWSQISTGQRSGQFTDKPETTDDHTLDAWAYPAISRMRWANPNPPAGPQGFARDRLTGAILR